jgi:hypothetical protein
MGAFGQEHGAVGDRAGAAFAGVVNAIADDADHGGDGERGGDGGYEHQQAYARQRRCYGLRRVIGRRFICYLSIGLLDQDCDHDCHRNADFGARRRR